MDGQKACAICTHKSNVAVISKFGRDPTEPRCIQDCDFFVGVQEVIYEDFSITADLTSDSIIKIVTSLLNCDYHEKLL
jgi:hypothetical protein